MRPHRPIRLTAVFTFLFAVIAMILFAFASRATATSQESVPNPDFTPACGSNVVLVLDESGSIGDAPGGVAAVRAAANAFTDGLADTGSKLAVIEFSGTAKRVFDYTSVTAGPGGTIETTFRPYFDGTAPPPADVYSVPTQLAPWTNWEAALQEVNALNTQSGTASLVVFITDGDPTAMNAAGGGIDTNVPSDTAVIPAITQANAIKTQGSHILGVAVGSAINHQTSLDRMIAVTGPDVATSPATLDLTTTDVLRVNDFSTLPDALRAVVGQICGLDISKTVDKAQVSGGSTVTWTVTVKNTGTADLTNVKVDDAVAPGCATTIPSLAVGASSSVTCTSTITADTTNTAVASALGPDQHPVGPISASASVKIAAAAITGQQATRLSIDKRGPTTAKSGAVIIYTVKVKNVGTVTAQNVVMRDRVPSSMSLLRRPSGARIVNGVLVVQVGNLAPGASKTYRLRVRIDLRASGRRTNTATANASNAATVRDRARTRIVQVGGQVIVPGVTG